MSSSSNKKQKPVWTILDNKLPDGVPSYEYPFPVPHSFDRGSYREIAEKVIIPKIVLDQIIDKQCWTERPHGHAAGRSKYGGGAAFAAGRPGVVGGAESRPKSSGRAKALKLRREKAMRPGLKVRGIGFTTCTRNISVVHPRITINAFLHRSRLFWCLQPFWQKRNSKSCYSSDHN